MAKLLLTQTWLNLLDTGVGLSFYTSREKTQSLGIKGEVRQYAAGNQVAISSKGVRSSITFELERATQTSIDILETWLGQAVVYRDVRSRAIFGVFFDLGIKDNSHRNYYTISVTLNRITYTEGV